MTQSRISFSSRIAAAAAITLFLISGCQINDPTKDLKVIVNTITRDNTVSVTLNDVLTGGVPSSIVTVAITGQDAGKVTDEVNNKLTSVTVNHGFLTFAIQNGTTFSAASPVKLILKITSAAYMNVDYPITITSGGPQVFVVNMVKKTDMATAGIEQTSTPTAVSSDNTGKTTAPIAVQTTAGSQVTIPQGTILKDASGSALSGKLTVATTVFYPKAAALIPQGVVTTGTTSSNTLLSLSVTVTDPSGKVASPAGSQIFIPVDNTVKNPLTGASFVLGDKLQMGYTDPATGQLVKTGEAQYVSVTSSKISNSVKQVGLALGGFTSIWPSIPLNLLSNTANYFNASINFFQDYQIISATITLAASFNSWDFTKAPMELVVNSVYVPYGVMGDVYSVGGIGYSKSINIYPGITLNKNAYLRVAGNDDVRLSATKLLVTSSNVMEYVAPANVRVYDVLVKGKCPNDGTKEIVPRGTVVTVYDETGYQIMGNITLNNTGEARLFLRQAGKYTVRSSYNDVDYEATLTVDASGVPVISGADIQVIRVDATVSPIVLQYYLLTTDACNK